MSVRLASEQAQAGHEVYVCGNYNSDRESEVLKFYSRMPGFQQLTLVNAGTTHLGEHLFPRSGWASVSRLITSGAVVHLHGVWDPLLFLASWLARRCGATYVISPHSMLYPSQMNRYAWCKKILMICGLRRMLREAGFVHAINEEEVIFLHNMDSTFRIRLILNTFPETISGPTDPSEFRRKHPKVGNRRYILFLGRLHSQKGLVYLGRAFTRIARHIPDVDLVVAGPDGGEKVRFASIIATAGLADRVYIPGPLYGTEKMAAMCGAECYCQPSLHEGSSMALLEALACGCPVVITEGCCFPEMKKAGVGLVVPLDESAIAEAVEHVLVEPDLRRAMSTAAKQMMASRPGWTEIANQMVAAYGDCLNQLLVKAEKA